MPRLTAPRERLPFEQHNITTLRFARTSRDRRPIYDPPPRTPAHEVALYIVSALAAIVLLTGCGGADDEPVSDDRKSIVPVVCTVNGQPIPGNCV